MELAEYCGKEKYLKTLIKEPIYTEFESSLVSLFQQFIPKYLKCNIFNCSQYYKMPSATELLAQSDLVFK